MPSCAAHIWTWFCDLSTEESLSYRELQAWVEMTGANPTPFEIEALRAMSRARREVIDA